MTDSYNAIVIEKDITKETSKRIYELLRMCHPQEHGEPYHRGEVINEIERRGLQILKDLGWNCDKTAIYRNRYTGSKSTLGDELNHYNDRAFWTEFRYLFSVLEHWLPIEIWTDKDLFDDYKNKETQMTLSFCAVASTTTKQNSLRREEDLGGQIKKYNEMGIKCEH